MNDMMKISKDEHLLLNRDPITLVPGSRYKVCAKVKAGRGTLFSAFFAVIILDPRNGREITRHIRWLNDFSGRSRDYSIVFTAPPEVSVAILGFRVNIETPRKSDFLIALPKLETLSLSKAGTEKDRYDDINDFTMPEFPALTKKQMELIERKMFWIAGNARSGTTWLSQRLLNHPKNILWFEPFIGHILGTNKTEAVIGMPLAQSVRYVDSNDIKFFLSKEHKANWLPKLKELLIACAFSQVQSLDYNIIIKEVGAFAMDVVMECFPRSKYCFLLRDGRDCIESNLDRFFSMRWQDQTPFEIAEKQLQMIRDLSMRWVKSVNSSKKAFDLHDPSLRILVKYEDLRDNTFCELRKIYDLIGIEISDQTLQNIVEKHAFKNIPASEKGPGKFNRAATTGGWKNSFGKKEIEIMNSIMGDTLQQFGYKL